MAVQIAKLASTAKTARAVAGRKVKAKAAHVGGTPWKNSKSIGMGTRRRAPGRPNG
jgi:hypothetical protein